MDFVCQCGVEITIHAVELFQYAKTKKFKQEKSWQLLWDQKGVLSVDFTESGTNITLQVYCETLSKLLCTI